MRAGKLDRTIRIDQFDPNGVDDYGTPTSGFTPMATLRAQILQQSTDEFIKDGATDETVIVFRTRWLADLTNACRVVYQGKAFDLKEVKEIGRREGLELRCSNTNGVPV